MAEPSRESSVAPTIQNKEAIVRLQKIFSFADGGTVQLHGAKLELRGGVNIDTMKKGTPIETRGKGEKRETNLVDFLQEDTSIQTFVEKAIEEDVLTADQLRAVKLPIASVTTGTEVAQKLDLSKPLTNIQKAEAIGLILQNIGQGNLVEEIAAEMNQKLKRTGKFASTPFRQMDYLNALTAAGGQTLLNATREADYRPYQITGEDSTRRKVSSQVTPTYESDAYQRELSPVTKDEGMDVFTQEADLAPELQESASVDLKGAQLMFNLFLPPSELLVMNKLALQIGRETDLGKKESMRHELVKKRQMGYIALLQANGVKGYEANGPIVRELMSKGALTAEDVNAIQGKTVGKIEKIMKQKGMHELNLHDANIESLTRTFSENYATRRKTGTVQEAVRNAFGSIEVSRDAITKLEQELGEKGFSKSQRTRKAYEQLWKQFNGALTEQGLALKKGETSQETTDTEEALKLFFFDRVRTELGMTERKIKFESGFKNPSDVRLSEIEDWGIKGLDLLYRRTHSTQVYKDVGDYDGKIRELLQKMAIEGKPEEQKPTILVQETPKKLDDQTEALRKTLEANLPNTPPVENLATEQAVRLSQVLEQVIAAQLAINQEPSPTLLNAVDSLVTAKKPEFHQSADFLLRIVLGEAVRTPAGRTIIDTLLPQVLEKLKDQPQRLNQILGVVDSLQQNGDVPDSAAQKLGAIYDKYAPAEKPETSAPPPNLDWLTSEPRPPTVSTTPPVAESKTAIPPPPEVVPMTVTHGVLEVTKDANGIVIKQLADDSLTGEIFTNGRREFAYTHRDINAAIANAELSFDDASRLTDATRNARAHQEGAILDALLEFKKTEALQTLEPHLGALGIEAKGVSSKIVIKENGSGKKERVLVFEVSTPVTLPFSEQTSKQMQELNNAATTAQRVELHLNRLNLEPVEQTGGSMVGIQLPAEVDVMVAKEGAKGAIGINRVSKVQFEGKSEITLNKGGEGKSSVGAIELKDEAALTITPQLAQDLNGQKVQLNLPESQKELSGYAGPGEYVIETSADGRTITVKPTLPIGGVQPPHPTEDLDIPAFLRDRHYGTPSRSTSPPPPFSPPTLAATPTSQPPPATEEASATVQPPSVDGAPAEAGPPPEEKKPGFRERLSKIISERFPKKAPDLTETDRELISRTVRELDDEPQRLEALKNANTLLTGTGPIALEIAQALAQELNGLAERKHKEKQLDAFEQGLLADQEVAVQFVNALDGYAADYNKRTKRNFFERKLKIIGKRATPVAEDAFGVDHIHLDRMVEELRIKLNRERVNRAIQPFIDDGEPNVTYRFIQHIVGGLEQAQETEDHNMSESIGVAIALLNLPDQIFSDTQRETVATLEERLGDTSNTEQNLALRNVVADRLDAALHTYAEKYNKERGGRIRNREPFWNDFPELANLLLNE